MEDLRGAIAEGQSLEHVPGLLQRILEEGTWRERTINRRRGDLVQFERFEDFVTSPPLEGLGSTVRQLQNLCRDEVAVLDLIDRETQGKPGGDHGNQHTGGKVDNINGAKRPDGASRAYALRRLRRDRPDLHAEVVAGEKSAHAAMIAAGFRKQPTPLDQLLRAWARATQEQRDAFLAEISP